jgi:non-ribosomal peptide synthetase component E (peptide arylation enzyme)
MATAAEAGLPAWYPPERVARHRGLGLWTGDTLTDLVRRNAERDPGGLCVTDGRRVLSFSDALDLSDRLAGSLAALGIGRGDRVVVQLPNWWEAVVSYYAIARLGAVFVPRMTIYRESEIRDVAHRSEAKAIIVPGMFRRFDHASMAMSVREQVDSVRHVVVAATPPAGAPPDGALPFADLLEGTPYDGPLPDPGDLHVILFTSGTTSRPKGAQHSFNTFSACARTMRLGLGVGSADRCLMPSPVMHNTGLNSGVLLPALIGAGTVLQDIWEADAAMELIRRYECTFSIGATPFVTMMLDAYDPARHDLSSMRVFCCGGAPVPASVVRDATGRLGFELVTCFGQSECSAYTMTRLGDSVDRVASSDGVATIGNEIVILDDDGQPVPTGQEGEICCRGAQIMLGYLGEPGLTAETIDPNGFCHSGDLGRMDSDGYLRVTGRKKDIIIRGGTNITPLEIEELLLEHPKVAGVAVVGYPDRRLGEKVCAVVVAAGGEKPTLAELVQFLEAKRIARQKLPERLELVDELPLTATGKVEKFRLREMIA